MRLIPSRLRRAVRSRIDARYVTKAEHRKDIKDTLWEVQLLRREVVSLRGEVDRLRQAIITPPKAPEPDPRGADAHRLATETAEALDRLLQNEILVWQAIDALRAELRTEFRARATVAADAE
ncbi:hypothetical protein [Microtetraspora sp. NBRC 16547]|uniref:hypothetical protein n=1 Tax=Microtetraspora sp. NBRC 16547 TaxID=3030993 RepID=UPI0025540FD8|nr:hypothetical protein [Microtetraspora sp. NBRC 16547]